MQLPAGYLYPYENAKNYKGMFWTENGSPDSATIQKMALLNQQNTLKLANWVGNLRAEGEKCMTLDEIVKARRRRRNTERDPRNCGKLNAAADAKGIRTPYFDGGLVKMNKAGKWSYMSTRNNNFSNRNQIGWMCVGQKCTQTNTCQKMLEDDLLTKMKGAGALVEKKEEVDSRQLLDQLASESIRVASNQARVYFLEKQYAAMKSA